ncbi:MAG: ribosomal L7Ae/L30e/S12e/Gadd45 family protein [Candidatus Spyradocola sp.]|jgi:large subunit ribosomal protein L7A
MNADLRVNSRRVVGFRQLVKHLKKGDVSRVFLAKDAQEEMREEIARLAQPQGVPVTEVPTMAELGEMCGIAVGSAAAGLLREPE